MAYTNKSRRHGLLDGMVRPCSSPASGRSVTMRRRPRPLLFARASSARRWEWKHPTCWSKRTTISLIVGCGLCRRWSRAVLISAHRTAPPHYSEPPLTRLHAPEPGTFRLRIKHAESRRALAADGIAVHVGDALVVRSHRDGQFDALVQRYAVSSSEEACEQAKDQTEHKREYY